jgi:hypothetical protein
MDVTRSLLPGMTPFSHRRALPGSAHLAVPVASTVTGGGVSTANPVQISGLPDGPDIVLPSGVHIRRTRIGQFRVSDSELQQAIRGVELLPLAHQQVIARLGLPIELVPVQELERAPDQPGPVLGLTTIDTNAAGRGVPTRLRVVTHSPTASINPVNSITEVVQHEIGHVIAVTSRQDRSEETAIAYATAY